MMHGPINKISVYQFLHSLTDFSNYHKYDWVGGGGGGEGSHGDAPYKEKSCPLGTCPHSSCPNGICTQHSTSSLLALNNTLFSPNYSIYSVFEACLLHTPHKWWQILFLGQLWLKHRISYREVGRD